MRLHGQYFELTDRFTPDKRRQAVSPIGSRGAAEARVSERSGPTRTPRLIISVPKRLLRSAVRRNAVKRVVRDSWRNMAGGERRRFAPPAVLVRLVRVPVAEDGARPSLLPFKRVLRADVDQIWGAVPRARARHPDPAAR